MMNNYAFKKIEKWAYDQFGLVILSTQHKKIISQFEAYLDAKQLDCDDFVSALYAGKKQLVDETIDLLTIQESYFFRDASLFRLLEKEFLPHLIQQKRQSENKSINIWSAGCACGEELYSIAILLFELILDIEDWQITLVGTDINAEALLKAEKALYSKMAFRSTDEEVRERYFVREGEKYELIEPIKKMVRFSYGNLLEKPQFLDCVDFIFCRNVFIYFDEKAIAQVLSHFDQALNEEGLLFLGCSDFVRYHQKQFLMNFKDSVTYLSKLSAKITEEAPQPKSKPLKVSYADKQKKDREKYQNLDLLLANREFMDVLDVVDKEDKRFNPSARLYRYKAEALIGLGDIVTAKEALDKLIKKDASDPIAYLLLGLLLITENEEEAKKYLNKAIDMKQAFPEAHYYLAMLYLGRQEKQLGLEHLEKAKQYAEAENKRKCVVGSDSNMGELLDAVSREITYYQERLK